MKKYLILAILSLVLMPNINNKEEEIIIPDEAIRFRVVANTDEKADQETKIIVKEVLEKELNKLLENSKSIEDTRQILKTNEKNFDNLIGRTLLANKIKTSYNINYGLNYFPEKKYKGITYNEGYYESLTVTLGNGDGQNWWCVLFPPLCLMDLESESQSKDVEYKSLVKEMIKKYL